MSYMYMYMLVRRYAFYCTQAVLCAVPALFEAFLVQSG